MIGGAPYRNRMRKRFKEQVEQASELRALFVLIVIYALRARRIIPTLRPHQLLIPATILQIIIFIVAITTTENFILTIAVGNLIVVALAIYPSTFQQPKQPVHWVKHER